MRYSGTAPGTQPEAPEPIFLASEGFERLGLALEHLRTVRLPRLISWMQEVMEEGLDEGAA